MTRDEIEQQLMKQRASLEMELYDALRARDEAVERVRKARQALENAPRLAVKRTRKPKMVELSDTAAEEG